uniref:G_PROTEIN_RECEP_F1_2 domain-containing protein n=1 Tax=Globodera pallida TaxID=36090 RepID=A0A183CB87_GLOPA
MLQLCIGIDRLIGVIFPFWYKANGKYNVFFFYGIMPLLILDAFTIEYFVFPISVVLQSLAYGSTAPVLFICNGQYRKAFRKQFGYQEQQVTAVQYLSN